MACVTGRGTSLYMPFRYVPPQRVRVFAPFWSGIGYSFQGSYGGVSTYLSIGSK